MSAYFGVNGVARRVNKMYIGVNGKARRVKKMYAGVNGKAKLVWLDEVPDASMTVTFNGVTGTFSTHNDGTWQISGSGSQPSPGGFITTINFSAISEELKVFMQSVGLNSFTIRFSTTSYAMTQTWVEAYAVWDYDVFPPTASWVPGRYETKYIRNNKTWNAVITSDGTVNVSQVSTSNTIVGSYNASVSITPTGGTINY